MGDAVGDAAGDLAGIRSGRGNRTRQSDAEEAPGGPVSLDVTGQWPGDAAGYQPGDAARDAPQGCGASADAVGNGTGYWPGDAAGY